MAEGRKLHIVMFPHYAFGHIIPFYNLSKHLAGKGHKISFISSPRNIQRLPKIPKHFAASIALIQLPLPQTPDLPPGAEATSDVTMEEFKFLKKAFDGLAAPMEEFLQTTSPPPDWIIHDFSQHWLPPMADRLGIKKGFYSTVNAVSLSMYLGPLKDPELCPKKFEHLTSTPRWITFPTTVKFRLHEAKKIFLYSTYADPSDVSDLTRKLFVLKSSDMIAVRSSMEFEPDFLNLVQEGFQPKPVIPLGLMPPSVDLVDEDNENLSGTWNQIGTWLDQQEKGSVVYVAFGSENTPNQEELTKLALGLEISKLAYFWVLRENSGSSNLVLPEGFKERTGDRGVVWTDWAPQGKILSHESVGGFLTHCGWSSVIEGLQFGRPLIMLPFLFDQGLNARFMVEKEVGIEVPRDEEYGRFTAEAVAESVRLVVVDEGGRIYRDKAREAGEVIRDQNLNRRYLENFEAFLVNNV